MEKQRYFRNKTARLFLLSYLVMMLLPLCVGLVYYYPMTRGMLIDKAKERSVGTVSRLSELMDTQLTGVMNMNSYIASNRQITEYDILNSQLGVKDAKEQLTQMIRTNTFIEHLFLYMRENRLLIGARAGTFYYQDITENPAVYQISFGGISTQELQELLDTAQKPVVVAGDSVVIFGKRYGRMLLFIIPVPQPKHAYGAALICVPVKNLTELIPADGSEQTGSILFFEDNGALLYSTEDLSQEVRQTVDGILQASAESRGTRTVVIGGASHLMTWATSAKYGWRYVNVLPTSVITREVNRLQIMTVLITLCVIAVSALLIFVAMKVNYLPIMKLAKIAVETAPAPPAKGLNDFEAIQTLIESLKTRNMTLGEQITQAEPQLRRFLIEQLLHGDAKELPTVLGQLEQIGVDLSQPPYYAAVADYAEEQTAEEALVRLLEGSQSDAEEIIATEGDEPGRLNIIIACDITDHQALLERLKPCRRLAVGEAVDAPCRIAESFGQAAAAMDYMRLHDMTDVVMTYGELPERVFTPRCYPLDIMQSLDAAIQHGEAERMLRLVDQTAALIAVDGAPPYFIRSVYFNAINLLITGLDRVTGGDNGAVIELGTRSMLSHFTVNMMVEILQNTAQQLARMMNQSARKEASMTDILDSIEQQIGSPSLSLQVIADEAGISAPAFSRMFKEKTGRNFKEYVDGLRIARAKRLLTETSLSVDQIALEVGYETTTSFYRLFKKYIGIAPGEYRQAQSKR